MAPSCTNAVRPSFDPLTDTYTVRHDRDSAWDASTTLVLSLGSLTDDAPEEMPPLGHAVDLEVLDAHVRGGDEAATVSFEFHDYRVTVQGDGRIQFEPVHDTDHRAPTVRG